MSIKNTENSQFPYVLCEASASNNTLLLPKNTVRICKSVFNTLVLGSQTNDGPSKERQGTLVFSSTAPVAHLNRYRIISMWHHWVMWLHVDWLTSCDRKSWKHHENSNCYEVHLYAETVDLYPWNNEKIRTKLLTFIQP